jgi:hypothetical protein
MRGTLLLVLATFVGGTVLAQDKPSASSPTNDPPANAATANPAVKKPAQPQPQGDPGPTTTTSGGSPASSPQGDSPPGMQPHPNDSVQHVLPKK